MLIHLLIIMLYFVAKTVTSKNTLFLLLASIIQKGWNKLDNSLKMKYKYFNQ